MDDATRIMDAVKDGKLDEVRRLLVAQPGLAVVRDDAGVSLLMMLAYRGAADLAALVAGHITPDIFEAAALGDTARLAEILAATPDAVHALSADGWTPLHLAGFLGQLDCAKLLLAHGASVSAYGSNTMRNMPLHAALAGRQNIDLVRLLLERGADVNATGATRITPLHLAASRGNRVLIDLLLARGADRTAKMENDKRPADLAREHGFAAIADALG